MIYGQMIINLGFVVLLILVYFYAINYVQKRKGKNGKQIQLLETLSLSNKEKIILLKAKGQTMLVGVTQNNINLLSDFDANDIEGFEEFKIKKIAENN